MLTVSIVNYRAYRDTEQCIRDLASICAGLEFRILVRDNSETPEVEALAESLRPIAMRVQLFSSPENPGFACGHNLNFRSVEHGKDDVFLILNPDVRLPDAGVIQEMLKYCSPRQIVSCVIDAPGSGGVWFSGGNIGKLTGAPTVSRGRFAEPLRRVDFVTGCCMAVSAELFHRLGGFDESYFMYSEDVDFCLRARLAGAASGVVNRHIVHKIGSGQRGKYSDLYLYEGTRNRLLCLRRHKSGILPVGIAYVLLMHGVLRTLQLAIYSQHPVRQVRAVWRGIVDGLRLAQRREGMNHAARSQS